MIALGFIVAVGLPLVVLVACIFWPVRIPPERTVDAIRARIEAEGRYGGGYGHARPRPYPR